MKPIVRWLLAPWCVASLYAKPDFVLILADDCTWSDLEIHGGQAKTPHLNALAADGRSLLQAGGYRTHLSGKSHVSAKSVFPFDTSGKGRNPDMDAIRTFLGECSAEKKPFLLIAASNEPHSPHNKGDASAYPPGKIKLSGKGRPAGSKYIFKQSRIGVVGDSEGDGRDDD